MIQGCVMWGPWASPYCLFLTGLYSQGELLPCCCVWNICVYQSCESLEFYTPLGKDRLNDRQTDSLPARQSQLSLPQNSNSRGDNIWNLQSSSSALMCRHLILGVCFTCLQGLTVSGGSQGHGHGTCRGRSRGKVCFGL